MPRSISFPSLSTRGLRLRCKSSALNPDPLKSSKAQGLNALVRAALTSGTFSLLGDVCAQILPQRHKIGKQGADIYLDWPRMARMASFGLLFYGPYQYKWYGALDSRWPSSGGLNSFLTKVTLNQIALSPVVLAVVFSWNLALTGQAKNIKPKISNDLCPTMINGWKFWVPAASVNFALVPLQYQVLYMSVCSVLWTGYLSHASNTKLKTTPAEVGAASTN